ncbi:STM3941 family protein [Alistipes sp.]|uniref:STM3941 family protein n=1 Tax=Alistipes sp. TaxID=1872444 RepID=UPI003AF189C9
MENQEDTRKFYLDSRKMLPSGVGCIFLAIAGAVLLAVSDDTLGQAIGVAANLFFGLGGLALLATSLFRSKRPYVIVSQEGVRVNAPLAPKNDRFLPWSAVAGFRFGKLSGKQLILIQLKDTAERIAGAGPIERHLLRFNKRIAGSLYTIETSSLACSPEELLTVLTERLERYRRTAETA